MRYLILLCILAGCIPPMRHSHITTPATFSEGAFVTATTGEEVPLETWWEQFQDTHLSSLITQALTYNYDLRIAREKICETRANFSAAFSRFMPYIDYFANVERMRNSDTLPPNPLFLGGTFISVYQMGFDAAWEIDLFGKIADHVHAAAFDIMAQRELVRDVHVSVAAEVAHHYFVIRVLQNKIAIIDHHIKEEEKLVAVLQDRYSAGLMPALDLFTAQAVLEARLSDLPLAQERLKQTVYSLAVLTGSLPESLEHAFDTTLPLPTHQGTIPLGFPAELLCRRGDIRQAEFAMHAAGARVLATRKELFPTISLQGIYEYATGFLSQWFDNNSLQWSLLPNLTLPLFHGGQIRAWIAAATSEQWQAALNYEKSVLYALQEVESSLVAYYQQNARIAFLEKEVHQYQEACNLAEILYLGGKVDFLYLIQSERSLYQAEILLADAKEALWTDLVAVYKALGGGWEC